MMKRKSHIKFLFAALFSVASLFCNAQTPTDTLPGDPGGLYVYTVQNLVFGAFSHGNTGGSLTISNTGSRSV